MRISVIVTYLTHDQKIKVQVLCPHTGTLGVGVAYEPKDMGTIDNFFLKIYSRESAGHFLTLMTIRILKILNNLTVIYAFKFFNFRLGSL